MSAVEDLLEHVIEFADNASFERLRPITELRKDRDEARRLYFCRKYVPHRAEEHLHIAAEPEEEFVMKVKFQCVQHTCTACAPS